jgi:hypothetical protein
MDCYARGSRGFPLPVCCCIPLQAPWPATARLGCLSLPNAITWPSLCCQQHGHDSAGEYRAEHCREKSKAAEQVEGDVFRYIQYEKRFGLVDRSAAPASRSRGCGSIPRQSIWDLWWTRWHWDSIAVSLSASMHRSTINTHSSITDVV